MNILHSRKKFVLGAVPLVALALTICSGCEATNVTKSQAATQPPATVVVAKVQQKTVPIYSEYVGQTKAFETVEVRARVEGVLQRVYFKEGMPVRQGALLFSIDKAPFEATLRA